MYKDITNICIVRKLYIHIIFYIVRENKYKRFNSLILIKLFFDVKKVRKE